MRCYIAGPMTGLKNFNFPAFDKARDWLEYSGHEVVSPADIDRAEGYVLEDEFGNVTQTDRFNREKALRRDFAELLGCDAVVLLPGWGQSEGALKERQLAIDSGINVWYAIANDPDFAPEPLDAPDVDWDTAKVIVGSGEVIVADPNTGGKKGQKLARFDLVPARPLQILAEHFGRGARKYEDRNWEKGYAWSLSFGAMQRHAWAFWNGEDIDEETGSPHLAAVAFHAFALLEFMETRRSKDDRPKPSNESFFEQAKGRDWKPLETEKRSL